MPCVNAMCCYLLITTTYLIPTENAAIRVVARPSILRVTENKSCGDPRYRARGPSICTCVWCVCGTTIVPNAPNTQHGMPYAVMVSYW